ncbi:unnamed protein product, partial [Musa textilis]
EGEHLARTRLFKTFQKLKTKILTLKRVPFQLRKGGVFIDPKWIQNWAPNLKSNLEFSVLGVRGGATACVSLLTDAQGRYHRPRQAVLPLQSGDWGGATAPDR